MDDIKESFTKLTEDEFADADIGEIIEGISSVDDRRMITLELCLLGMLTNPNFKFEHFFEEDNFI